MNRLLKQIIGFIGISGIGWILDFIIYNILCTAFNFNLNLANTISSFIGVTFVFIFSTRKLFISNSKINIKIKYILYIIYQIILILFVSYIMTILKNILINTEIKLLVKYINIIVKIIITPFTMIINFIVMKYLIEKI